MATDWEKLSKAFQAESERTGISVRDWCERRKINPNTARRYLKKKNAIEKTNTRKIDNKKHAANPDSERFFGSCSDRGIAQESAQIEPPEWQENAHFLRGAQAGNTNSQNHGFYKGTVEEHEIRTLTQSNKVSLDAELGLMRVRAFNAASLLRQIAEDLNQEISTELRNQLWEQYCKVELRLNKIVLRVESISKTMAEMSEADALLKHKSKKIRASIDKDIAQRELIKKQVEEKTTSIVQHQSGKGGLTSYEIIN